MDVDVTDNKMSSDDEYEEEEILLYLDFQSKINSESLEEPNLKIKMIGFETDEPIVQINNKIFRGTFEHAMGTNVFFDENLSPPPLDPNFDSIPSKMYKYHSQTNKVLKMERIFITPKKDGDEDELQEKQSDDDDVPKESYLEALNQFLNPGEVPPRTLSGCDVLKPSEFQCFKTVTNVNEDGEQRNEEIVEEERNEEMVGEERNVEIFGEKRTEEIVRKEGNEEMVGKERNEEMVGEERNEEILGEERNEKIVEEESNPMEVTDEQVKSQTVTKV